MNTLSTRIYHVGDRVWHAHCGCNETRITCPVCYGKKAVTVILGNGDAFEMPCDFCGKGYEGPRGTVTHWQWVAEPVLRIIDRVEQNASTEGTEMRYYAQHYVLYLADICDTKEQAIERCNERSRINDADQQERLINMKEYDKKSYSWHVGYHLREVKEAQRKLEWHGARAVACKAKAKS